MKNLHAPITSGTHAQKRFGGGERATRRTGLTLTVKSWTEVADDAAAMLGRGAGGVGGEEEELSWVGEKRRPGGSVQTKPRADCVPRRDVTGSGDLYRPGPRGVGGLDLGWDDRRCDECEV